MIGTTTIEHVIQGIGSSLQDSGGGTSSMRIGMMLWSIVLSLGVAWCVVKTGAFPDIPQSVIEITLIWVGGKVWQKGQELKAPADNG